MGAAKERIGERCKKYIRRYAYPRKPTSNESTDVTGLIRAHGVSYDGQRVDDDVDVGFAVDVDV